jgi:phage-related protein
MNIDDKLSEIFNLEPIEGDFISKKGKVIVSVDNAVENDCDNTRNNLYGLLQSGQDALESALEIAKQSEHPRAFEVVGNLIKQLADINHQLLDVHIKKQKMTTKEPEKAASVTNNSIFVGSTSELNKFLDNMKKGE